MWASAHDKPSVYVETSAYGWSADISDEEALRGLLALTVNGQRPDNGGLANAGRSAWSSALDGYGGNGVRGSEHILRFPVLDQ